ncbi:WG repeat-containing protein [Actinoplanes siamensis]|nr:WG repeat-containing protein [Actinoplanes siamensis]
MPEQEGGFPQRRPAPEQEGGLPQRRPMPEQGGPRTGPGPRQVSPAGPTYGSARPAPPSAFPARRDAGRTPEAPFDLRPVPQERNSPAPARPAAQPTRVTPQQPVVPPAAVYPGAPLPPGYTPPPAQAHPGQAPAHPGQGRPGTAPRPGPAPVHPVSGVASAPVSGIASAPVSGMAPAPVSGMAPAPVSGIASAPVPGQGPAAGAAPVSGIAGWRAAGVPEQELGQGQFAHGQVQPGQPAGASFPSEERTQAIDPRRAVSDMPFAGPEAPATPQSFAEAEAPATPQSFAGVERPVTGLPLGEGTPQPAGAAEPATEPRGLGWLLSMSGLGAETPVPETSPLADPEIVVEAEPARPAGWFIAEAEAASDAESPGAESEAAAQNSAPQAAPAEVAAAPTASPDAAAAQTAPARTGQAEVVAASDAEITHARLTVPMPDDAEITQTRLTIEGPEPSALEVTQARLALEDVPAAGDWEESTSEAAEPEMASPAGPVGHHSHARVEELQESPLGNENPGGDIPEWIAAAHAGFGRHERAEVFERPGRHEQPETERAAGAHEAADQASPGEPEPAELVPVSGAGVPLAEPTPGDVAVPTESADEIVLVRDLVEEPVSAVPATAPVDQPVSPAPAADLPAQPASPAPAPDLPAQPASPAPTPDLVARPVSGVGGSEVGTEDAEIAERPVSPVSGFAGQLAGAEVDVSIPGWPPAVAEPVATTDKPDEADPATTDEPDEGDPAGAREPDEGDSAAAGELDEDGPAAAAEVAWTASAPKDGGVSAGTASAGAGPASGDAHGSSEPGSVAAHHHSGTEPVIALADDTATETTAAVPPIVEEPVAGGTDRESASVDGDTSATGSAETADTAAETPAAAGTAEPAGVPEAPAASEVADTADTAAETPAASQVADTADTAAEAPATSQVAETTGTVAETPVATEAAGIVDGPVADPDVRTVASGSEPAAADGSDQEPGPRLGEAAIEPIRQRRDQRAPADRRRADPEEILAAYPWMFDPRTLREQIDEPDRLWDLIDRLTDRLEFAERDNVRAGLLSLRAVVSRVLGELDDALADGREALRHAEASGEARTVSITQTRLAHVLQWRGEFGEADRLYARADSPELPARVRAEIRELAGRSAFEQGRLLEAVNHFERALDLCQGGDPELVERIELALDVISRRSGDGWGPYPRSREELLNLPPAPVPLRDDGTNLWGYAAAVEPRYAQAQPFAEGVAWVRRPESPAWELIDASGAVLIGADSGYLAAGGFAEGVAWVTRDAEGGWFAIDRNERLIVPGGFEDVRPFRNGLALFRRGGAWGAVDKHGRIAVQPKYRQFATVLSTGGPVDGFSDTGFAVVDAGTGFGVVDRAGQQVLAPVHKAVVLHPSAFLIADEAGRWGAVDRQGQLLVETRYVERADAVEEIGRARPDRRPVL